MFSSYRIHVRVVYRRLDWRCQKRYSEKPCLYRRVSIYIPSRWTKNASKLGSFIRKTSTTPNTSPLGVLYERVYIIIKFHSIQTTVIKRLNSRIVNFIIIYRKYILYEGNTVIYEFSNFDIIDARKCRRRNFSRTTCDFAVCGEENRWNW